jgi:hypothetical protein
MINCSQLALCFYQIERIQKDIEENSSSNEARQDKKQKTKKSFSSVVVRRSTSGGAGNNNTSKDDFETPDPSSSCWWYRNEIQSLKKKCDEQQIEIRDLRERCKKYEDDKNIHDQEEHKKEEEECCPIDVRKEKQEQQETSNMMVTLNNKSKDDDHQYNDSSISERISSMEGIPVNEDDKKNDDIGHSEYIIPLPPAHDYDDDGDCDETKGKTCAPRRSRWSFFSATRARGRLTGSTNTICTTTSSDYDSLRNLHVTKERRIQPKDHDHKDSSPKQEGVVAVGDNFCTDDETTTTIRSHIFYNHDDERQKEERLFSANEVLNLERKLRSREKEIRELECFIGHNATIIDAMHLQIQNLKRFMK